MPFSAIRTVEGESNCFLKRGEDVNGSGLTSACLAQIDSFHLGDLRSHRRNHSGGSQDSMQGLGNLIQSLPHSEGVNGDGESVGELIDNQTAKGVALWRLRGGTQKTEEQSPCPVSHSPSPHPSQSRSLSQLPLFLN